jgi:hypothetical protein
MLWLRLFPITSALMSLQVQGANSFRSAQCRAASEIIRDVVIPPYEKQRERPVVFDRQASGLTEGDRPAGQKFRQRFAGALPPEQLTSQLDNIADLGAVSECAEVQKSLKKKRIRFDDRAIAWGSHENDDLETRAIILGVSLPALSADGKEALFLSFMYCGGRCADSSIKHVKRDTEGKWSLVRDYGLWVS